jgi:hypothetical protein
MLRVPAFVLVLGLAVSSLAGFAQQSAPPPKSPNVASTKNEALIDALTSYPFGEVYFEDITAANSITHFGKKLSETDEGVVPAPPVRGIAELGTAAIPLLISHLADQRPSQALYRQQPVPVAYLALDLLLHMTDMNDERVVVPGCEQHGLTDCMQPEFYFSPDTADPNTLASVRQDWAAENKKQPINFVYPTWWRPDAPAASAPQR